MILIGKSYPLKLKVEKRAKDELIQPSEGGWGAFWWLVRRPSMQAVVQ
jgi:hypothetical protein